MRNLEEYRIIYGAILDALDKTEKTREELIHASVDAFSLSGEELANNATNARLNVIRSKSGTVINEMTKRKIIALGENSLYRKATEKPVALRLERCEEQILSLLHGGAMTKTQLKSALASYFGTLETETVRDDNMLAEFIGEVLKSFLNEGLIEYDGAKYAIKPQMSAKIRDRHEMALLRADFLTKIHERGGEFFESFFMNLLEKYLIRSDGLNGIFDNVVKIARSARGGKIDIPRV